MTRGIEARRVAYSLAAAQHGVIARRQLRAEGLSHRIIDHWLSSGYMLKVITAVYALGRPATEDQALWMAATLHAGPGAALAGASAAVAWGLADRVPGIEVARPEGARRRVRGFPPHQHTVVSLRRASLEPGDVTSRGPIPIMTTARLLIDLAGRVSGPGLRRYFIEAGRQGLLTPICLDTIRNRSRGFNGRGELMALHQHWDPSGGRIRSVLEGEFRLMCSEQSLPLPFANQRVGRYEVDCLWPEAKLIVELDGRRFHGDAVALAVDSQKTRDLRSLGFRVRRFTWLEITERPTWVAAQIREELGVDHPPHRRAIHT